jgi:hypothetical protein
LAFVKERLGGGAVVATHLLMIQFLQLQKVQLTSYAKVINIDKQVFKTNVGDMAGIDCSIGAAGLT